MIDPYREGEEARMAGKTIHENPYARLTQSHARWNAGWIDAQELVPFSASKSEGE